jgi:molybdopterin-guanine dinucleotide biosynthesis protein A
VKPSAVVLAGGKALRMGGEKPLRELRGKTLLQHAIDLVAPLAGEVVVSAGERRFAVPPGVQTVPDPVGLQGKGPLSGVLAGLQACKSDICVLLPCDLPNLTQGLLAGLLDALGENACAYCELDDGQEPLVAALRRKQVAKAARAALQAGRYKVVPCWEAAGARVLDTSWVRQFGDPARLFANINTPDDLSAA